jgi:hypothetical protein
MASIEWQTSPKEDLARNVFATANHIRIQQSQQRRLMLHYLQLYSNGNCNGLGQRAMPEDVRPFMAGNTSAYIQGSHFNMCAMVCDTAASMVSQSPPLPIYITSGDNLKLSRKAEKRTKVLQSQLNALSKGVFAEAFDYCVQTGTGVIHGTLDEHDLPLLESVNPLEILVEHLDGQYRKPRSLHRVKYVSKAWLATMYPGKREAIMSSSLQDVDTVGRYLLPTNTITLGDLVEVVESWYLPTGNQRGRHSICVTHGVLIDESYTDSGFPFAFCRWKNRPSGFWGIGLIECVRPSQNRVNQLIARVARGQDLASNVIVFSPDNGEGSVNPDFITNKLGLIIPYDPLIGPPTLGKWDGTMVDLQQQIDLEVDRVLRENGLSDSQVNGEGAGAGLTSGVAVRAADDVQSRRLFHPTSRFEEMCLEATGIVERLNDELAERDGEYSPRGYLASGGVNFMVSSKWSELQFEAGEALLNLMPMSKLPTTPQGKWAAIQEWIQAGFIQKSAAMKLLEFPALDEYASLETAMMDLAIKQICDLLDGKQVLPLPRQSVQVALDIGTKAWAKLMQMVDFGDEDDLAVIDNFESWLDALSAMADNAQAAAQPMPADPGAAPAGGGIAAAPVAAPAMAG